MNKILMNLLGISLTCLVFAAAVCRAETPQDLILVLDNSGSLRKSDPELLIKGAVRGFIERLPAGTRAGIIIFDQDVELAAPLAEVDEAHKAVLAGSVDGIDYRGRYTDSPSAIERAIYELKTNAREGATKTIVFVSDGDVDTGDAGADIERLKWLRDDLGADAANKGVKFFAVAFTENADFLLIQSLASRTGGDYVRAAAASDLAAALEQLAPKVFAAPIAVAVPELAPPAAAIPPPPVPAPPAVVPEPAPAPEPPASAAPEPATGPALTDEERASLEQLAKETGIPIEQLLQELEGAPAGQAVVVRPADAAAGTSGGSGMLIALLAGAGAIVLALIAWFMFRGRRKGAPAARDAVTAPAKIAPKPSEAFLLDTHNLTNEPTRRLGEKPVMVGRIAGSDGDYLDYFVVNRATVGRRHAVIKYKDYAYWIVDQGSVNGTFVNDTRVQGERKLKHGDRIKFHKFEFEFSQPDMADASDTVIASMPAGDQTIIAGMDQTLSATSSSALRASPTIERAAVASTAAAAADDMFGEIPVASSGSEELDVTAEGELEALERDKAEFFSGSGSHGPMAAGGHAAGGGEPFDDSLVTQELPVRRTGDEDDEEAFGVEIHLPAVDADDKTRFSAGDAAQSDRDFDAEASAFFEDVTVGSSPDVMSGPRPDAHSDLLDITAARLSGIGDDDTTGDFTHAAASAKAKPGEATGGAPGDTSRFGQTTTVLREALPPSEEGDVTMEDFIATTSFDAPKTIPPAMPKAPAGVDDVSLDEFLSTAMFDGKEVELTNEDQTLMPDAVGDDEIIDITAVPARPSLEDTVVMPRSDADDDDSEAPTIARPRGGPKPR